MEIYDLVLFLLELMIMIGLFFLTGIAEKCVNPKWKLCYLLPFVFVLFIQAVGGYEVSMIPTYLAGLLCIIGFFKENPFVRKMTVGIATVMVLGTLATVEYNPGYREIDYVGEFEEAFSTLKEHYALSEHKKIDWDMLYEKYHEKFTQVKAQHDPIQNILTWKQFCLEFHDGHVSCMTEEEDTRKAIERVIGNDYGFSLITLSNGDTVAVNVEEHSEAFQAGIRNGTLILEWNHTDVQELFGKVDFSVVGNIPLKETEDFYRPILAAGMGEEEVSITFVDKNGKEQTADIHSCGSYYERFMQTLEIVNQGVEASNLALKELTKDTYVLRIKEMQYDADSYANGDHSAMQAELRDQLNVLKEKNVNHLIIDIRSNGGGSPHMVMAIAQLFAPVGEYSYAYEGVFDKKSASYEKDSNGKYKAGEHLTFVGENIWENRKVTILVNAQSISAADHFAYIMKSLHLKNVTIMGFHKTNASGQAVSSIPLTNGMLIYSCIPTLTADGDILIDPDDSREGGIELDIQIPFDEAAVKALFDEGEDYVLKKALEK